MSAPSDLPDRVWWPNDPIRGESLLGFCVRTMDDNVLPHMRSLLADAGQKHRNRHADVLKGEVDADALAALLGVDVREIEARRGIHAEDGFRTKGIPMRATDLCASVRRFAPAALAREPHHRHDWGIRTLPFCTETLEILQSQCSCERRQGWTMVRAPEDCEDCGRPLSATTPILPAGKDEPYLRRYADLFSGEASVRRSACATLPPPIRHMPPEDVREFVLVLASFVRSDVPFNVRVGSFWRDGGEAFTRAIASAWRQLERWPQSLTEEALGLVAPNEAEPRKPGLRRLGRLLGDLDRELPDAVRDELARVAGSIASPGDGDRAAIDYFEAEALLHHRRADLRNGRRKGLLKTRLILRRGELLPALDRREIEAIATRRDAVGAAVVGRQLLIPRYGVEQLADAGLLDPLTHPYEIETRGLAVSRSSVESLVARIEAASREADGDQLSLSAALSAAGGGERPFADALSALLAGNLPFSLKDPEIPLARRILIRRSDIPLLPPARQRSVGLRWHLEYVQEDVCSILGIKTSEARRLHHLQIGSRRSARLYDRDEVLGLAAEYASSSELSTLAGVRGRGILRLIRRARLGPPGPFGWPRPAVLNAAAAADARSHHSASDGAGSKSSASRS